MKVIWIFFVFLFVFKSTGAFSKQGIWENVQFSQDKEYMLFTKSMYQGTVVSLKIACTSESAEAPLLQIEWLLRYSPCAQEFQSLEGTTGESRAVDLLMTQGSHEILFPDFDYDSLEYINGTTNALCDGDMIFLPDKLKEKPYIENLKKAPEKAEKSTKADESADEKKNDGGKAVDKSRRRRADTPAPIVKKPASTVSKPPKTGVQEMSTNDVTTTELPYDATTSMSSPQEEKGEHVDHHPSLVKVWKSGYYIFIVKIKTAKDDKFDAKLTVAMKGKVGYISAVDWPLLIFYGVMGLVYIIYGLVWLVLLACNWRDLMRLQYWIGGVIVLGMLEKAVFYAVYQSKAKNGKSVTEGTVIFAAIVSSLRAALAKMLVIIVSVGFGIVKQRLSPTFHKVLFVGGLYFILATVEGSMRTLKPKGDQSTDLMLAALPLAVVDIYICWWIFSGLVKTTRQLRLRKNVVKLTLYRHFTYTLIFTVLASVIFMIWSVVEIKMKVCLRAWREIWLDEAYWHLLFSIILAIIMILWRPSSNNQRYAFSPLLDAGDDEDDEDGTILNDAFDGMKNGTKQFNGSPIQKQNSIEDDLKGV